MQRTSSNFDNMIFSILSGKMGSKDTEKIGHIFGSKEVKDRFYNYKVMNAEIIENAKEHDQVELLAAMVSHYSSKYTGVPVKIEVW